MRRGFCFCFVLFCFFFHFSLFKMNEICFWSTKMGIFYRVKAFHAGKKIRKNDFAPSEKFSCYAPVDGTNKKWYKEIMIIIKYGIGKGRV